MDIKKNDKRTLSYSTLEIDGTSTTPRTWKFWGEKDMTSMVDWVFALLILNTLFVIACFTFTVITSSRVGNYKDQIKFIHSRALRAKKMDEIRSEKERTQKENIKRQLQMASGNPNRPRR